MAPPPSFLPGEVLMQRLLVSCLLIASATSVASGFYFGDNGAKATVQGGAFTAQAEHTFGVDVLRCP